MAVLPAAPLTLTRDIQACAGVQALIGHITTDTMRWSPSFDPFDKVIAGRIHDLSVNLDNQGAQAETRHIQDVVHSNAGAFRAVADAMAGNTESDVSAAITKSRTAFRELKSVCALQATSDH